MAIVDERYDRVPEGLAEAEPDVEEFLLPDFFTARFDRLARVMRRHSSRFFMEEFGLSMLEWRSLALLAGRGPKPARDMATLLEVDKSQISRSVAALQRRGLVTRPRGASGRRVRNLKVTPKGMSLYRELLPLGRARQKRLLSQLTPQQRVAVYEAMIVLTRYFADDGALDVKEADAAAAAAGEEGVVA